MTQWHSIKDEDNQPIINETILLTDSYEVTPGFLGSNLEYYMDGEICEPCELLNFHVTHWMPLPEPPKE